MDFAKLKNPLSAAFVLFVLISGYFIYRDSTAKSQPVNPPANSGDTIFFWGEGCPHCENVENFFAENGNLDQKMNIKKIEVFGNQEAQKLFLEKIKECGLASSGVPVLYQDGKCVQGDKSIIDELKKTKK
ncbi:MAG: hypothetical protein FJZ04_03170 [Candidatus Moranbacteria bacterium]|nr:hypothetical protein [Candidatus Moranbacteria bacterium]